MPVGSVAEGDFLAAVNSWNNLSSMFDRFTTTGGSSSCAVSHGNNLFDVWVTSPTGYLMNGANGVAIYIGYTKVPQTCADNEWDILINNSNLVTGVSDEFDWSNEHRRGTMAHELGHVLALDHTSAANSIMVPIAGGASNTTSGPYAGRSVTGTFAPDQMHAPDADDVAFAYDFHGNGSSSRDAAVNLWMRSGSTMVPATPPTIVSVCDGSTPVNVSFTYHNRGTLAISSSPLQVVLSTDEQVTNTDTVVWSANASAVKGYSFTSTLSFVVPEWMGTAAGLPVRVGVVADPAESLSESMENNNVTRLAVILVVFDC
jgi:hypothetical protein